MIVCPVCGSFISGAGHIDGCGFGCHEFHCRKCSALVVGVMDPYDDELLLTLQT